MAAGTTPGQERGKHNPRRHKQANDSAAVIEMQKAATYSCYAAVWAVVK